MKGNACLPEAMNPSATPFVSSMDKDDSLSSTKKSEQQAEPGSHVWRPKYKGRIQSFSEQQGFGFIDCEETLQAFKREVFIHRVQMAESGLWVGQDVMFEVHLNKNGCPQARNVTPLPSVEDVNNQCYSGCHDDWGASMGYSMQTPYPGGNSCSDGGSLGLGMPGCGYDYMQGGGKAGRDSRKGSTGYMSVAGICNEGFLTCDVRQAPEPIELMLPKCTGSADMWKLIEQYGHSFSKKHVVAALYQQALFREDERRTTHASLTNVLVDRLVLFPAKDLTADEAAHVLWAFAKLEEVRSHDNAHRFAVKLAQEASNRYHEFSPKLMASFVTSLTRLIRSSEEDDLVGTITRNFSEYAGASGALPRSQPEELRVWTNFLQEVSVPSYSGALQDGALSMGRATDGSGPFWGQLGLRPIQPGLSGQAKTGKGGASGGIDGKAGYGPDRYGSALGGRNPMESSAGLSPSNADGKGKCPPGKGSYGSCSARPQWTFADTNSNARSKGPPGQYAGPNTGPAGKGKSSSKAVAAD